jgi:hypothetical protein
LRDADEARWLERQIEIDAELHTASMADQERG